MHLALALILFYLNIKRKNYHNVRKYFPNIFYVVFVNSLYYYFFKHYLLWEMNSSFLKVKVVRALYIFFIMPHVILLYLSDFPREISKQIIYILKWIGGSAFLEFIVWRHSKAISFHHRWTIAWSICIYAKMYIFTYLLTRKPIFVLNASVLSLICFIMIFKPPFSRGFIEGPILKLIKRLTTTKFRFKSTVLRIGE
jgi:hypothetical protein